MPDTPVVFSDQDIDQSGQSSKPITFGEDEIAKPSSGTALGDNPLGPGSAGYKAPAAARPQPRFTDVWYPRVSQEAQAGAARASSPRATASKAAGMPVADVAGAPHDPQLDVPTEYNPKTGMPFKPSLVPALDAPGFVPGANLERNVESAATELSRFRENDKPAYGVDPNNRFGPPVRILPEAEEERQRRQRLDAAAGLVDNAMNVAGPVTAPMIAAGGPLAVLKAGAGIAAGYGASEGGGALIHGKVSPEEEHAARTALFFLPSLAGTVAGLKTTAGRTPEGGRAAGATILGGKAGVGVRSTPEAFEGAVKVGDTRIGARIPRNGGAPAPAEAPAPAAPLPAGVASMVKANAAEAMAKNVVAGRPPIPPPPAPPPTPGEQFGNKLSGAQVDHLAKTIAEQPEAKRNGLIEEAHQNLTQWVADNKGKVIIDGTVHLAKTPDQAETLAAKLVNDAVAQHDKATAEAAKVQVKPERLQQPAKSSPEAPSKPAAEVKQFLASSRPPKAAAPVQELQAPTPKPVQASLGNEAAVVPPEPRDDRYDGAKRLVMDFGKASASLLQRRLSIDHEEAESYISRMEGDGIIKYDKDGVPQVVKFENAQESPAEEPHINAYANLPEEEKAKRLFIARTRLGFLESSPRPDAVRIAETKKLISDIGGDTVVPPEPQTTQNLPSDEVVKQEVAPPKVFSEKDIQPAHSKPIYEMATDELHAAAGADLAKGNAIIDRVFGKGADEYRRLQKQAGDSSKSFDETQRLTAQMDAMEKRLSPEQRKMLYREDDSGISHGDYISFRNALMHVSGDTPQELGHSMRHAVTDLGDADLHDPENMSLNQQRAYAQLRHGFQRAAEEGFDANEVWQAAVKGAAKKFRDPEDAALMLERFTKRAGTSPVAEKETAQLPASTERRTNVAERKRVADMKPEEMARELHTSRLDNGDGTHTEMPIPNGRAFHDAPASPAVAMSDSDGLKAFNDKFGYKAGNAILVAKGEAAKEAGLDAYHQKGDEFLYHGESPEHLKAGLEKAREILRNREFTVTDATGKQVTLKGVDFSYGTGPDLATAESGLKAHKQQREASGERARGELRGITEVGHETAAESGSEPAAEHGRSGAGTAGSADGKALADQHANVIEFKPHPQVYKTSTQGEVRGRVLEFKRKAPPPKSTAGRADHTADFIEATKLEATDPKAAMAIYDRLVKDSNDPEVTVPSWVNRGVLFYNERKFTEAIDSYQRALELEPHHAQGRFNLASALEDSGQTREAVPHYEQAIKDAPSWADPYYNLARLQQQLRNNKQALEMYRAFLKRESTGRFADAARDQMGRLTDYLHVIQGKRKATKQPVADGGKPALHVVQPQEFHESEIEPTAEPARPIKRKAKESPAIKNFDNAIAHTGAEVKTGQPSPAFAEKIKEATHLEPANDAALKEEFKGAEYQREYFTSALQQAKAAWVAHLPDYVEIVSKSNKANTPYKLAEIYEKITRPETLNTDQIYIKVPSDGHFLVNNTPYAIEKSLKGAREGFTPPKQQESKLPNHRSPKEFDNEKYIVQIEKELADLKDRRKGELGNSDRANHLDEQIRAAKENLAEAKKLTGPPPEAKGDTLQKGDKVTLADGRQATVVYVHPEMNIARVKTGDGKTVTVGLKSLKDRSGEAGFAKLDIPSAVADMVKAAHEKVFAPTENRIARGVDDTLYQLGKQYDADVLRTIKLLKSVGPTTSPEDQEAIYHHKEDSSVRLNQRQQGTLDNVVQPLMRVNSDMRAWLNMNGVPMGEDDGYIHRVVQGKNNPLERAMRGKGGTGKGNVLSKAASSLKGRRMFAAEDEDGKRVVIHRNGDTMTAFDNGSASEFAKDKPGLQVGDEFNSKDGQRWTLKQATTKEIEEHTGVRYYKSALANTVVDYLQLRRAERANDALEGMKADPEFKSLSFKPEHGEMPPPGWRTVNLPQFNGYYFEPHMAETLDRFADELRADPAGAMEKIGNLMTASLVLNPARHVFNIGNHWLVERGVTGNFNPLIWPRSAKAGIRAIKAVMTQNDDFVNALDHGAPMMSHRQDLRELHQHLVDSMLGFLQQHTDVAAKIAELGGHLNHADMLKGLYKLGQKMTWMSNDMFFLQSIYEKELGGMTFDDAAAETAKHIPDYRIPSRVLNSPGLSKFMNSHLLTVFSRYHYGVWKSYGQMLKEVAGPESSLKDRAKGLDHMLMLGLLTFVGYELWDKLLKHVTGDPKARMVRSGASAVPYLVNEIAKGNKPPEELIQGTFTPAVLPKTAADLAFNRDLYSGGRIYDRHDPAATIAHDVGKKTLGALGPSQQVEKAERSDTPMRDFLAYQGGVTFPNTEVQSPAVRLMHEILRENMNLTPELQRQLDDKRARIQSGNLTQKERKTQLKKEALDELSYYLPHVARYSDVKKVFNAATPEEKEIIRPIMLKKAVNVMRNNPIEGEREGALAAFEER